nr:hypothetical protein [Tanacetum cinerariifolium]
MKSTRVTDPKISTDVPSWLIDIIKSFKRSQLKQTVKINMLEKRLVGSKEEVQQFKNRIDTLKHESQPVEVDDHVSIKSQSNFYASVFIVGGFKTIWSAKQEVLCTSGEKNLIHESNTTFVTDSRSKKRGTGQLDVNMLGINGNVPLYDNPACTLFLPDPSEVKAAPENNLTILSLSILPKKAGLYEHGNNQHIGF